jgi:putative superfamily III holin-X
MRQDQQDVQDERGRAGGAGAGSGPDGEPTWVLIRRLVSNIGALLRAYAQLTRDEGVATVREFMGGLALLGAAALVAVSIPGLVLIAAIVLLSLVVQLWAAALIVLGASVLIAGVLVLLGLRRLRFARLAAIGQKIREDVRWLQDELRGKR